MQGEQLYGQAALMSEMQELLTLLTCPEQYLLHFIVGNVKLTQIEEFNVQPE